MWFEDERNVKCSYCSKEWIVPHGIKIPSGCPFCGKEVEGFYPHIMLANIIDTYGIQVLDDDRRFKAIIDDLFFANKALAKRIIMLQRERIHYRYFEISDCKDHLRVQVLHCNCLDYLKNELGLSSQIVKELDEIFYKALVKRERIIEFKDDDEAYFRLAEKYCHIYDIYEEDKDVPSDKYYRIMAVSAYAGNEDAQKILCEKFILDRVEWIDNTKVREYAWKFFMTDMNKYKKFAKIVADAYAYGLGEEQDLNAAYFRYILCFEDFETDVEAGLELFLRGCCGFVWDGFLLPKETMEQLAKDYLKAYESGSGEEKVSTLINVEKELNGYTQVTHDVRVKALMRCVAYEAAKKGQFEKGAFWLKQTGSSILHLPQEYEERYKTELPNSKDVYDVMLKRYLEEEDYASALRFLEAADKYDKEYDYGLLGYIYYHHKYGVMDHKKSFEYNWKAYQSFADTLDYCDWDEYIGEGEISKSLVLRILLDLVIESQGEYLREKSIEEILKIISCFEQLEELTDSAGTMVKLIAAINKYAHYLYEEGTIDELKQLVDYFDEEKILLVYNSMLFDDSEVENVFGEYIKSSIFLLYGIKLFKISIFESVPYLFNARKFFSSYDSKGYAAQFLALCQICGVEIEKNVDEGIELFVSACNELDHLNVLLFRLAKLLENESRFGERIISANLDAANKIKKIAEQVEDVNRIKLIGFDSSYTGLIATLISGWDENIITFYNYRNLSMEENNEKLLVEKLKVPSYIIDRLKAEGYDSILQFAEMKLSQARMIPKLGIASVEKLQRAMRDYYAELFWEEINETVKGI